MPTILTIIFSIVSSVVFCPQINLINIFLCTLVSAIYCFGFGLGSKILADILDSKFDWLEQTNLRLIVGFIANTIFLLIVVIGVDIFIIKVLNKGDISLLLSANRIWKNFIIFTVAAAISTIFHAKSFMIHWKNSIIKQKELEKENISSQYSALKSQTDPHFFFNSLNTLSSLIEEKPKTAEKFVQELASIYRYILEQKNQEISLISEEITFIKRYLFLQKIRFENGISFNIELTEDVKNKYTISLALQIIFENIFKHNIISEDKPITIEIKNTEEYLIITNNINPKSNKEISNKIGVNNIISRYQFFTDKKIIIEKEINYSIHLPLLSK